MKLLIKKSVTFVLCVAVLVSTMFIGGVVAAAETPLWEVPTERPDFEGKGTAQEPYMITNGAELYWAVKNDNANDHFKLANDITLNEMSVDVSAGTVTSSSTLKEWRTEGNTSFSGTLDGDNHVIRGLYIDHTDTSGTDAYKRGYGLISGAWKATIKNLGIENSYIKVSGGAASPFVGTLGDGGANVGFENCYVGLDVYVSGDLAGGFIAGGKINNVTGGVKNCYNIGTMKSADNKPGGVYGNCYGTANADNFAENVYCKGTMFVTTMDITKTNCYANNWSTGVTNLADNRINCDTILTHTDGTPRMKLGDAFVRIGNNFPVLKSFTDLPENIPWNGFGDNSYVVEGRGYSADTPYIIETAAQLAHAIFWNGYDGNGSIYYKLANDIYFNDVSEGWLDREDNLVWIQTTSEGKYGTHNGAFKGHIDGNGYTVQGIYLPEDTTGISAALIPVMSTGSVKNLGIRNSQIIGKKYAAGVVGHCKVDGGGKQLYSLFVDDTVNVKFTDATSGVGAGGIIGYTDGGTATHYTDVQNCYSSATLYAARGSNNLRANGIVGCAYNSYFKVMNCYSFGFLPYKADNDSYVSLLGAETAYKNVYTNVQTQPWKVSYTVLTTEQMIGSTAFEKMVGFADNTWYGVEGKAPFLRCYGKSLGDVDENGAFNLDGDAAALRQTLIGVKSAKHADFDKNGNVDICDLVALNNK